MRSPHEAVLQLPPDATSAAEARRFIRRALRRWGCDHLGEVAELLVSELVANAIRHAGTSMELHAALGAGQLTVQLRDRGPGWPRPHLPRPDGESGRGLFLVDQLAQDWGIETEGAGKGVWFRLEESAVRQGVPAG